MLTIADRESRLLAPYAMFSANSRGRKQPEAEHPYRGPFQRDRDRILHSSAFRRLSGKMQVFTGDRGDYHRTRLTHTHEVASIARTIGRALQLNEDLIEALALFHDIGHPPFGHAGEDALDECLSDHGGFSHNRFALTIAEELELRVPTCPGLNLTRETLDGQTTRDDKEASYSGKEVPAPLLEVQVVEAADSMTYDAHDTDDAVKLGLVTLPELAELALIREAMVVVREKYGETKGDALRKAIVHELIDRQVGELLRTVSPVLAQTTIDAEAIRRTSFRLAAGPALAAAKKELETFLYARVYRHPQLIEVRSHAQQRLKAMFAGYCQAPELLPRRYQSRAKEVGLERATVDYLAGMTDRFCDHEFERLFRPA